jgi:DNA invertase Pin-like site-specific DNA recombinase
MKVGYARVSTKQQSLRGQVDALCEAGCDRIFTDLASGGNFDRPGLADLFQCVRYGDTLCLTQLDRLGRDMLGLLQTVQALTDQGLRINTLDMGYLDPESAQGRLLLHSLATQADFQMRLTSRRTRAGLKAARNRGVKLGGTRNVGDLKKAGLVGSVASGEARVRCADVFARQVYQIVQDLQLKGVTSLKGIASELNARGVGARRGGEWSASQVKRILGRVAVA